MSREIIEIELNFLLMSAVSCTGCVVILNQQNEQNIAYQQQSQDESINHSKSKGKNCTVVENGRVVVISSQPDETADFKQV